MKRSFFQVAVASILLYGCTTWTLTKRLEKKLDGNYTRMLRAILKKSWRQHPTRHQLYGHLPPITKTIQVRRTRLCRTLLEKQGRTHKGCTPMDPHIKKQDDQHEHTFSSYVRIRDVAQKTCQRRWTIGKSGERGSEISVLPARDDDDDDDDYKVWFFWPRLSDPFVCQSPIEIYVCHFLGQMLGCAYTICSYGQIEISCTSLTYSTHLYLVLYSFCANLLHSLITWLIVSSLSQHNLHLLFCWVLSVLALIWLVLMALSCAAIWRDSVWDVVYKSFKTPIMLFFLLFLLLFYSFEIFPHQC